MIVAPARALALFRLCTCLAWLLVVDLRVSMQVSVYPRELLIPPGVWRLWIDAVPFSPRVVLGAYALFLAGMTLAITGVRARAGLAIVLIAGGYLVTLPQLFGKISHYNHVLWLTLLLVCSPCADALTLRRRAVEPSPSAAYGLPLQIASVLIGLCYFFPGAWKLVTCGVAWADGHTLRTILWEKWAELGGFAAPLPIDESLFLCRALSAGTIVFELAFLPMLFAGRRARCVLVIAGVLFHAGALAFMRIDFTHLVLGYVAVLPWWPKSIADARVRPEHRRSVIAVSIVGAAIIAGTIRDGVCRGQNWPLGLYPTFEAHPRDHRAVLVARVTMADGTARELTEDMLGDHTLPERARGLCAVILQSDVPEREVRCRALWRVWVGLDSALANAAHVRWIRRIEPLHPDAPGAPPDEVLCEHAGSNTEVR